MTALKPCGTRAAYVRHLRLDEEACEPCLIANAERGREERAVYSRARTRAVVKLKQAQPDLFDALHAVERARERRRSRVWDVKARDRARQAAYRALARELPEEFAALMAAELDREQRQAVAS